jgi:hypothetical protein
MATTVYFPPPPKGIVAGNGEMGKGRDYFDKALDGIAYLR